MYSCLSASPPPVCTLLLQKHNSAVYPFFKSSCFFIPLRRVFPPFVCPLLDEKGVITNLVFRIIPPRLLEASHLSVSVALSLYLSSVEKHPFLSLSPLSLSLSVYPPPSLSSPVGRPLTRSRQLQRSVCLLCRSSVRL